MRACVAVALCFQLLRMVMGTQHIICRSMCGNQSIRYPFSIDVGCGLPQFQMTCSGAAVEERLQLLLNSNTFNVQTIDYEKGRLVIQDPSMSDCGSLKSQSSGFRLDLFGTGFSLYGDTLLLLNCLGFSQELNFLNNQYDCHNPTCLAFLTNCHVDDVLTSCCRVTDPANSIDLDPLQCMSYTSIYTPKNPIFAPSTWSYGIELEWSVPTESADSCELCGTSNGVCGYSIDDSGNPFTCICDYGNSTNQCQDCFNGSCQTRKSLAMSIGLSVGGTVILFCIVSSIVLSGRKRRSKAVHHDTSVLIYNGTVELAQVLAAMTGPLPMTLFSYKELEHATAGFAEKRLLGDGGYGIVYKAHFCDGRILAVKKLNYQNHRRLEQFCNEVRILAQVRHPNLVQLIGFCLEERDLLLVYEYVSNGTLEEHLHAPLGPGLPWETRLHVAIGVAEALSYLHFSVSPPILHRDVKSSNILLDQNFEAKVADFGLSRLVPMSTTHVSTAPQGTPGYVDPEYHQCYRLTDKSDVYSFGVVLVELLSGKRVIDMDRHGNEVNLSTYAIARIQSGAFDELLDPSLYLHTQRDAQVKAMVKEVAELAFKCIASTRTERPNMRDVGLELQRIQKMGKPVTTVKDEQS